MNFNFLKFRPHKQSTLTWRQILPNLITSGNTACGMTSLILTLHGNYTAAGWVLFLAVCFDFMDGFVARWVGGGTQFGLEFDSLSDVVSFCAAPSFLFYCVYMQSMGIMSIIVSCLFLLCGALRLARYNIVHVSGYFQGMPVPAGGLFLVSFVVAGVTLNQYIAAFLALLMSAIMVSSIRYSNIKALKKGYVRKARLTFLLLLMISIIVFGKVFAPMILMSIYVVSGLLNFDWGKWLEFPIPE
ncbi:MAG: CDP-diacylglycerol--serine O-phosphatidyltransferase [Synergistaceae bacterium]|nr:CDP-diacylglycerol--serine O-phosphatidyltransferase [Synergistaceae bacterium]